MALALGIGATTTIFSVINEGSEQFVGGFTSGNTFGLLGVRAASGRTLTPNDARPGAPPVFVLNYKLW